MSAPLRGWIQKRLMKNMRGNRSREDCVSPSPGPSHPAVVASIQVSFHRTWSLPARTGQVDKGSLPPHHCVEATLSLPALNCVLSIPGVHVEATQGHRMCTKPQLSSLTLPGLCDKLCLDFSAAFQFHPEADPGPTELGPDTLIQFPVCLPWFRLCSQIRMGFPGSCPTPGRMCLTVGPNIPCIPNILEHTPDHRALPTSSFHPARRKL